MAGLRKLREKWYARIYFWDGYLRTEKLIPLKTDSKTTASIRLAEVNRYEIDIKAGENISFAWQNEEGVIKYKQLSIIEVSQKFHNSRKTLGLAESTIKRNIHSLNLFMKIIGKSIPIESITTKHTENFKDYCSNVLGHTSQGVNINLRLLKTFFRWCARNEIMKSLPYVQMIKIPQSLPSYISDEEWNKILKSKELNSLDKKIFTFARDTGCRLSEPFHGKINGHWLIIPAEYTKSKIEKEIFLSDELIAIWYEMKNFLDVWLKKGYKFENLTSRISKRFLKVCRSVKIKHCFHHLRHTFAVRRYLQTRDIYLVKKELCHLSVSQTEKYAKFSLRRLAEDFPSLIKMEDNSAISPIRIHRTDTQPSLSTVQQ